MQKKSLWSLCALLSLFVALLAFSSCSDKDKDPKPDTSEPSIVGVWDAYKAISQIDNEPEQTELIDPGALVYNFRSDGKISIAASDGDEEGTYELLENNKIKFTNSEAESNIMDIVELTDKKMALKSSFEFEDDQINYTIHYTIYFNRE